MKLAYLTYFYGIILLNGCKEANKAAYYLKESYNYCTKSLGC